MPIVPSAPIDAPSDSHAPPPVIAPVAEMADAAWRRLDWIRVDEDQAPAPSEGETSRWLQRASAYHRLRASPTSSN